MTRLLLLSLLASVAVAADPSPPTNNPVCTNCAFPEMRQFSDKPWLYPSTNRIPYQEAPNALCRTGLSMWYLIAQPGLTHVPYDWCGTHQSQYTSETCGNVDINWLNALAVQPHASNVLVADLGFESTPLHWTKTTSILRMVAPGVQVTNVLVPNLPGFNYDLEDATGISNAVASGAKIISYSRALANPVNYPSNLYAAMQLTLANNILFVAAAENGIGDNDTADVYPLKWRHIFTNMLTVGGHDLAGDWYGFVGHSNIDLAAPAHHIIGADIGRDFYMTCSGTWQSNLQFSYSSGNSFGVPMVSGATALCREKYTNETIYQTIDRIKAGAKVVTAWSNNCVTSGRLDMHRALIWQRDGEPRLIAGRDGLYLTASTNSDVAIVRGSTVTNFTVEVTNSIRGTGFPVLVTTNTPPDSFFTGICHDCI